jgi:hypothetical protein
MSLMRLSVKKAAHANVSGAAYRKSGVVLRYSPNSPTPQTQHPPEANTEALVSLVLKDQHHISEKEQ